MDWTQTWTTIAAIAGVIGLQSFWIARSLDAIARRFEQVDARFDRIDERFDRVDVRFDRVDDVLLRDHGERIARLEERERA